MLSLAPPATGADSVRLSDDGRGAAVVLMRRYEYVVFDKTCSGQATIFPTVVVVAFSGGDAQRRHTATTTIAEPFSDIGGL
uniref:Uncharacterized protein n=1 Tax=Helianthus annuus TaxID=4232 RepID=A0A251U9H1_HELAN